VLVAQVSFDEILEGDEQLRNEADDEMPPEGYGEEAEQ